VVFWGVLIVYIIFEFLIGQYLKLSPINSSGRSPSIIIERPDTGQINVKLWLILKVIIIFVLVYFLSSVKFLVILITCILFVSSVKFCFFQIILGSVKFCLFQIILSSVKFCLFQIFFYSVRFWLNFYS
jgi:hypothetical protein